jgi:hypothetical protein
LKEGSERIIVYIYDEVMRNEALAYTPKIGWIGEVLFLLYTSYS